MYVAICIMWKDGNKFSFYGTDKTNVTCDTEMLYFGVAQYKIGFACVSCLKVYNQK